jgi:hypothetical protein
MAERKNVVFLVTSGEKKNLFIVFGKRLKKKKNRIERKEKNMSFVF